MTETTLDYGTPKPPPEPTSKILDFFRAFTDLLRLPRAFWFINLAFMMDSMAYFGILTLMTLYLPTALHISDAWASPIVGVFTLCVTLFMLGPGSMAEVLGIRRGLILALVLCLVGRVVYSVMPLAGGGVFLLVSILLSLFIVALGEGILQPLAYAGVRYYTDEKTNSMGYGLLYAVMNLGIFVIGLISPQVRVPIKRILEARAAGQPEPQSWVSFLANRVTSGYMGVNWACAAITALALLLFIVLMTRHAEAEMLRPPELKKNRPRTAIDSQLTWADRIWNYFAEGPFTNGRFLFFIFMLFPVQTLFAHQWLTMPSYVLRAYSQGVADRMEWLVNWINPAIIFLGVPIATALTRRVNVYTMMIVGSAVSALPTFLLSTGPSLPLLITYLILFSIGEALWQPRFLQYAAELAPPGKVAQYMGLANVPWITVKGTTSFYSGYFLGRYCPESGPQHTDTMWLIYGLIAVISPIGLLLARRWVMSGWEAHKARPTGFPVIADQSAGPPS